MTTSVEEYARRRALWYAWLRDPEHRQARMRLRVLRSEDGIHNPEVSFCSLGGACEVYHSETGKGHWDDSSGGFYTQSDFSRVALPKEVVEWLGMGKNSGRFFFHHLSAEQRALLKPIEGSEDWAEPEFPSTLVSCNDQANMTFAEIAAFAETNPPGLWLEDTY